MTPLLCREELLCKLRAVCTDETKRLAYYVPSDLLPHLTELGDAVSEAAREINPELQVLVVLDQSNRTECCIYKNFVNYKVQAALFFGQRCWCSEFPIPCAVVRVNCAGAETAAPAVPPRAFDLPGDKVARLLVACNCPARAQKRDAALVQYAESCKQRFAAAFALPPERVATFAFTGAAVYALEDVPSDDAAFEQVFCVFGDAGPTQTPEKFAQLLSARFCTNVYVLDERFAQLLQLPTPAKPLMARRYGALLTVKDFTRFALLMHSSLTQSQQNCVAACKRMLRGRQKSVVLVSIEEITPEKLDGLPEIEAFVYVGCPIETMRLALAVRALRRLVLSPHELCVAFELSAYDLQSRILESDLDACTEALCAAAGGSAPPRACSAALVKTNEALSIEPYVRLVKNSARAMQGVPFGVLAEHAALNGEFKIHEGLSGIQMGYDREKRTPAAP